jgi:hypothetical protein
MTIHASVRGSVVTAVVEEFARHGGDPRWVLERHGLTPALLADPFSSVSLGRYVAMFEDMAMRLDDPLLGARLGQAMRAVDLGPAGMLVARSRSVMVALERLTRFVSSFQPGTQAGLKQCDDLLVWTYRLNDAAIWPRRQDAEFTLASTLRLIRSAFAPDWQPLMVQFEHAPASPNSARALEKLLGCPVRFEAATNGMVLPAEEAHTLSRRGQGSDRRIGTVSGHLGAHGDDPGQMERQGSVADCRLSGPADSDAGTARGRSGGGTAQPAKASGR